VESMVFCSYVFVSLLNSSWRPHSSVSSRGTNIPEKLVLLSSILYFCMVWSLDYIRSRMVSLVDIVGREAVSRHGRAERLYLQTELN
jgi:hypothetical protein